MGARKTSTETKKKQAGSRPGPVVEDERSRAIDDASERIRCRTIDENSAGDARRILLIYPT